MNKTELFKISKEAKILIEKAKQNLEKIKADTNDEPFYYEPSAIWGGGKMYLAIKSCFLEYRGLRSDYLDAFGEKIPEDFIPKDIEDPFLPANISFGSRIYKKVTEDVFREIIRESRGISDVIDRFASGDQNAIKKSDETQAVKKADKPLTWREQIEQDQDFKDLFNSQEYKSRDSLQQNECFILAHLMAPRSFVLTPLDDAREQPEVINIGEAETQVILKHKFFEGDEKKPERWFNGFVPERRRVIGHITFAAGTAVPFSVILFDRKFHSQQEKYDAPLRTHVKFDGIPMGEAQNRIHEAIKQAESNMKATQTDYFLDRAIILSGESIRSWYTDAELSFFSAWRSIEAIAKRNFRIEEKTKGATSIDINNRWNAGRGIARKYIDRVLANNNIKVDAADLDLYQKLRNYVGHGSVDIVDADQDMLSEDASKYADISSKCYKAIRFSRELINSLL